MKRDFKKLLTFALAAYSSAAYAMNPSANSVDAELGKNTGFSYIKVPDFLNSKYVITGAAGSLSRENSTREEPYGGSISVVLGLESLVSGLRGTESIGAGFGLGGVNGIRVAATENSNDVKNFVDIKKIIHMSYPLTGGTDGNPFSADGESTYSFKAGHKRYFVDLSYAQDLGNFYEGLKFGVSTAFVKVANKFEVTVAPGKVSPKSIDLPTTGNHANSAGANSNSWNGITPESFFDGSGASSADTNRQTALGHGKFGKNTEMSELGLADIRAWLGLEILSSDNGTVCAAIEGVIPTGKDLKGEFLWEPVIGSRHFKLGARVDAMANLADGSDYSANLNLQGLWHYSFPKFVTRIPFDKTTGFGQYALGYVVPSSAAALEGNALTPIIDLVFKNQSTVYVRPGHMVSVLADVSFEKGCLVLDASYNFRWSSEEQNDDYSNFTKVINVANSDNGLTTLANSRAKDTTAADWSSSVGGTVYDVKGTLSTRALSQMSHSVNAAVGFVNKEWQYPSSVCLGGGYTFAPNKQRNPETWSLYIKGTMCF